MTFSEGRSAEVVVIPNRLGRSTVCVSSQVGCRRGCVFCATGLMPKPQNLSADEIELQVTWAHLLVAQHGLPPLRNVVFMGMGEPLDNPRAVEQALARLIAPKAWALAPRHLTVSTVAPSPTAVRAAVGWPGRLAWSLHAAQDEVRRALVPTTRHSVAELAAAFSQVVERRNQPLFVEITLIDGLNDSEPAARAAVDLFQGFSREVRFNLLPVNPGVGPWRPSPAERVDRFRQQLADAGYRTTVRKARGAELYAACGQLVAWGELRR